ncbi:MAG: hypothetical protein WD874_01665, partial [Parcubacteria group bacterium]
MVACPESVEGAVSSTTGSVVVVLVVSVAEGSEGAVGPESEDEGSVVVSVMLESVVVLVVSV